MNQQAKIPPPKLSVCTLYEKLYSSAFIVCCMHAYISVYQGYFSTHYTFSTGNAFATVTPIVQNDHDLCNWLPIVRQLGLLCFFLNRKHYNGQPYNETLQ